jgi:cathepsin A (carboxypeptidase C)
MQPFHRLVPGILEQIPVLIYAGDADFICNWLGNQAWTEALEWPGQKDFNKASIKDIKLDNGDKYGKIKNSGNFTFLQIFGAGHMYVELPRAHPKSLPFPSLRFSNNANRKIQGTNGST